MIPKYIGWLNGTSVAVGSIAEVERKATEIYNSKLWQEHEGSGPVTLKITTYGKQLFAKAIVLGK